MSLFAFLHGPGLLHRPDASVASALILGVIVLGLLLLAIASGAVFIYGFHSGIVIG